MSCRKLISCLIISIILSMVFCITAFAGTYSKTENVNGSFSTPEVSVTNGAGGTNTGRPYRFSSPVTNVTKITSSFRLNSKTASGDFNIQIYYSSDGVNFLYGTTIACPMGEQVPFTIDFGSQFKTVSALFFMPDTRYWPGYNYSVWNPNFTRILTDNTAPSISLSEQYYYSKWSVNILAYISDSESGVSIRKWAQGFQSTSYFASGGTSFSGSFYVTSNGYYTVYARDNAGNAAVNYIYVTKLDNTPPIISATASSEWNTTNMITVNISDDKSGVSVKKWAYGRQSATYFQSNGNTFSSNIITVDNNGIYTFYARDVAGNESSTYVTVSYVDNTISVTHPLTVNYTINPNSSEPFIADDIRLINNSRIKVKVSVKEFSSISGGSNTFTDVPPTYFSNWNALTAKQTKKNIALGLRIKEKSTSNNGWYSIGTYNPLYAANIHNTTWLGTLYPNGAKGNLQLIANHGLAWDNNYTARHRLVLLFETV